MVESTSYTSLIECTYQEVKMGDLDGIESDSDYRELPFDSKDDMMTFNMVDEDDNIMESHEIPVYAYNRVMRKAKEAGVPFLSYVSHIARKKLIGSRLDVVLTGEYEQMLEVCDQTSPYALTGSIFALDRGAIVKALDKLRHAAGNFYINDKPTGAVVGQQPFGGSRASGTNDKAGSWLNLERWVSPRTIKETFLPPRDFRYPYMEKE